MTVKLCTSCRKELPLTQFHNKVSAKDGKNSQCKSCRSVSYRDYYQRNTEAVLAKTKKYWQDHPERHTIKNKKYYATPNGRANHFRKAARRRALKLSLPTNYYTRSEIYERDAGVCSICGYQVDIENYHIDHVIPLQAKTEDLQSYGISNPGDVSWNVAVAHPSCNSSKSNTLSQESYGMYCLLLYLYGE